MRCFVPGCNLKYTYSDKCWPERESFFRVPKGMLVSWQLAIPKRPDRALTHNDYVCSRHFPLDAFYPTAKFFAEYNTGSVKGTLNVPKKVNILSGVVPSIFPGSPDWLVHQQRKRSSATSVSFPNCKKLNIATQPPAAEVVRTTFDEASLHKVLTIIWWQDLLTHAGKILLPNSRWMKVVFDEAACKTMSFMETSIDKDTSLVSVSRQLSISCSASTYHGDRFRCKTYVWKTEVPVPKILGEDAITGPNLYDIQAALWLFANQTLCKGGPKVIKGCNFKAPCMYIDETNTFRHIDCTLFCFGICLSTKQCPRCQTIDELLRQNGCFDSLKFVEGAELQPDGQMQPFPVKIKVERESDEEDNGDMTFSDVHVPSHNPSMQETGEYDQSKHCSRSVSTSMMDGIGTYCDKQCKVETEDFSASFGETIGNFFIKLEKD